VHHLFDLLGVSIWQRSFHTAESTYRVGKATRQCRGGGSHTAGAATLPSKWRSPGKWLMQKARPTPQISRLASARSLVTPWFGGMTWEDGAGNAFCPRLPAIPGGLLWSGQTAEMWARCRCPASYRAAQIIG